MSLMGSQHSNGSISVRENARVLAVSYVIPLHSPCPLFPLPNLSDLIFLSSCCCSPCCSHTGLLVALEAWQSHLCLESNDWNIGFCSNVNFSMRYFLIIDRFHTTSHISNPSMFLLLSITLSPFDKYCTF